VDGAAAVISGAASGLASLARFAIGQPAQAYVSVTGLAQRWAMFSNPPQFDSYWRVRYYIQPVSGPVWMATELIGPAHREDQVRLVRAFRDSYQDKALEIAYEAFSKRLKPNLVKPGTQPKELPDDLAPIGRYFARRFAATRLGGRKERIVRTEVWMGRVDGKPLGSPADRQAASVRRAALLEYVDGPVEDRLRVRPYAPYHAVQEESGISWLLEYFEES